MNARHDTVIRMWRDGRTASAIGEVLDVDANTVHKMVEYLRGRGVDLASRKPNKPIRETTRQRGGTPYEQMLAGTWPKRRDQHQPEETIA